MPAASIVDRSFILHEQLGEGGMGTVYRATQLGSGQSVALKLVSQRHYDVTAADPLAAAASLRLALAREFQTLASLHHPNLIRVLSYGFDDTLGSYFTMELLPAPQTLIQAADVLPFEGKVRLLAQLLRALAYVHRRAILHRDIKPSNVLVSQGEVKLVDFGIAVDMKTDAGLAGTPEYLAPELLLGYPPSVASDLYSVGVLAYQMFTGHFPYSRESMTDVLHGILGPQSDLTLPPAAFQMLRKYRSRPHPGQDAIVWIPRVQHEFADSAAHKDGFWADVPGQLGSIIRRLVARQPEDRYTDAHAVMKELAVAAGIELQIETTATRESFLQATTLVGRDDELRTLQVSLREAAQGRGNGILVGGESGVGKSRLLSELRTLALVHGFWVVEGQSTTERGVYYQEWQPLLRSLCFRAEISDAEAVVLRNLLPDIFERLSRPTPQSSAAPAGDVPARAASTLIGLLARQTKPLLLILEDLQWACSESLTLLTHVSRRLGGLPMLVIASFRSDEAPQLAQELPSLDVMLLSRLDSASIAQLSKLMLGSIGERPDLIDYLTRQTEGNVFFLVEIMRALAADAGDLYRIGQGELPESVLTAGIERIIERRIERLPASFQPLLELAATHGRKLDLLVLERASSESFFRTFLIECANAAVLESQGSEWRFAHDKLRERILMHLGEDERRQLHRRLGELMEEVYTDAQRDELSPVLAFHCDRGDVPEKALKYFVRAGDRANTLCLFSEARTHYAYASQLLSRLLPSRATSQLQVDLLLKQVQSGLTHDPTELQLQRLELARTLIERLEQESHLLEASSAESDGRLRMARVDYYFGRVYYYSGQPKEAIRHFQKVLPVARDLGDQELLLIPSLVMGMALCMQGHFGRARDMLGSLNEPVVRHLGICQDSIRCVMCHSIALIGAGQYRQALPQMERVLSWTLQVDQPVLFGTYLIFRTIATLMMSDWPELQKNAGRVLEIGNRTQENLFLYASRDFMGWAQSELGQHEQALENRARAAELRRALGGGIVRDWFEAGESQILLNAGQTEKALRHAQEVAASSQKNGLPFSLAIAERVWGCAASRLGSSLAEAESHFATSLEISRSAEQVTAAVQTELFWGRVLREHGQEREAQLHFGRAIAQLEAGDYAYALEAARRIASQKSEES